MDSLSVLRLALHRNPQSEVALSELCLPQLSIDKPDFIHRIAQGIRGAAPFSCLRLNFFLTMMAELSNKKPTEHSV
jgi:hypothetical protein